MAAASSDKFSEILTNVLRLLNLESISLREQQVNVIRVIVEKRRDVLAVLPTGFGKSLIFQLLPFVFNSWLEVSDCHFGCIALERAHAGSNDQTRQYASTVYNDSWRRILRFLCTRNGRY